MRPTLVDCSEHDESAPTLIDRHRDGERVRMEPKASLRILVHILGS